jgi:two-component sensor histidine kinase
MTFGIHSPACPAQNVSSLSGEADHRIANSLAMIASLIRKRAVEVSSTGDPRAFLLEMAARVDAVGILHRLVAQSAGGTVQLSEYLNEICGRLSSTLALDGASFSVVCSPEQILPFTMAAPLGLLTAELFSNSLKYAHPAGLPVKVSLSCSRAAQDRLRIVYEDDGVGFPEGFDVAHDGHVGMQVIRLLSQQLHGTYKWDSDPLGIRFELSIPTSIPKPGAP